MNDNEMLSLLEEAAGKLSMVVEYDDLRKGAVNTPGGAFVLRGERHILLHRYLPVKEKIEILAEILARQEIEGVELPPAVRHKLESARNFFKRPVS
ncbi:MAG: hypothetical protein HY883_07110 [Deltaproteobacteria bacterium]|nr:hypothetical protein [Deltaproteobacteria bacterium]